MEMFLAIFGTVLTVIFGIVSVLQYLRDMRRGVAWDQHMSRLTAVEKGLSQIRAMLTEACDNPQIAKNEQEKQFIRDTGHHVLSIEHQVQEMRATNTEPPGRGLRTYFNNLIGGLW